MAKGQAERLVPLLQELMDQAGCDWDALDAIGVGIGPGNFTGVRLAVATARGLALSLQKPAIGVSSLESAAFDLPRPLMVLQDARRGAVYAQLFLEGRARAPYLTTAEDLTALDLPSEVLLTGSKAVELAPLLHRPAIAPVAPVAAAIAQIAVLQISEPPGRPAPLYLRAPDAATMRDQVPSLLP